MAMERTRVAKVEDVKLIRRGHSLEGILHLTPHHLIFTYTPKDAAAKDSARPPAPKEIWITYPIIQTCTLRASALATHIPSAIRLRCRDFTFLCLCFKDESKARDVFDSIKAWTTKVKRMEKLYAFNYTAPPPEQAIDGWSIYNPRAEWKRQGVSEKSPDCGWRISTLNTDYSLSPTYPALLPVPSTISDTTLSYAGKYRSRVRLPVLTYLHPVNNCSITRCAQPLVGVRQNRSIQDEKLLLSIFSSNSNTSLPSSRLPSKESSIVGEDETQNTIQTHPTETKTELAEDSMIANIGNSSEESKVYGAQQHNLIVDARPTVNAYAMQAVGMGTENMDNYPFASKVYLGIDNIHVMRDSLNKVIDTLKESDITPLGPSREALTKSGWLKHIANMLDGVGLIARQVGLQHSHVVIHCSDGWDRTSQLSALAQLCLDPYYRTLEGFIVLVEKDWLSFGHMFAHRSGFFSSEKWFHVENDRSDTRQQTSNPSTSALENAFLSAKGFFKSDSKSKDTSDSEDEGDAQEGDANTRFSSPGRASTSSTKHKHATKVKETAPIFHQFLDATYQLMYQNPTRFEFTERFLRRLLYHLYSCQYGTFLYNSEKERVEAGLKSHTTSVWSHFLSRKEQFLNPKYESNIDDHERGKERLIFPRTTEVRWWAEMFGREDAEMNGKPSTQKPRFGPSVQQTEAEARGRANSGQTANVSQSSSVEKIEASQAEVHAGSLDASLSGRTALTGIETAEKSVEPVSLPTSISSVSRNDDDCEAEKSVPSLAVESSTPSISTSYENLPAPLPIRTRPHPSSTTTPDLGDAEHSTSFNGAKLSEGVASGMAALSKGFSNLGSGLGFSKGVTVRSPGRGRRVGGGGQEREGSNMEREMVDIDPLGVHSK